MPVRVLRSPTRDVYPVVVGLYVRPRTAQKSGQIEDQLVIAEYHAKYSYRLDSNDSEGFAELFTKEAVKERRSNRVLIHGSRVLGRQELVEYAKTSHDERLTDRQTRHHMSSLVFLDLSAEAELTENIVLITHQTAESVTPFINAAGIYRNTWKKTDQSWRIAKRVLFSNRISTP